jgi:hypothetical protein
VPVAYASVAVGGEDAGGVSLLSVDDERAAAHCLPCLKLQCPKRKVLYRLEGGGG